jgi:hypothetical protein
MGRMQTMIEDASEEMAPDGDVVVESTGRAPTDSVPEAMDSLT